MDDAIKVKKLEKETNHDLKAVEYVLKVRKESQGENEKEEEEHDKDTL